jgi:hypothetical protein
MLHRAQWSHVICGLQYVLTSYSSDSRLLALLFDGFSFLLTDVVPLIQNVLKTEGKGKIISKLLLAFGKNKCTKHNLFYS